MNRGLAPLLLLVVALVHYGYEPLSQAWFGGTGYAARNLFYILRGIEGVILFALVGLLVRYRWVGLVCIWGMLEEGQTAACRIAKGVGEPNKAYQAFMGLCGSPWYTLGLMAAIVLAVGMADRFRENKP